MVTPLVGQKLNVEIVFIKSAKQLYVQDVAKKNALLTLLREVYGYCNVENSKEYHPQREEIVCAKFEDVWYRASVTSIERDSNFGLLFIDYGNEQIVSAKYIKPCKQDFLEHPCFSMCVELDKVPELDREMSDVLMSQEWVMEPVKIAGKIIAVKLSSGTVCINDILGKDVEEVRCMKSNLKKHILKPEQKFDAEVVFCQSAKKVYIQMTKEKNNLQKLMSEIQAYCTKMEAKSYSPQQDEIVCAMFTDRMWYRACTLKSVSNNSWNVHFIDYGNDHEVSLQDIRPLEKDFILVPVAAICVELDRVSELDVEACNVLQLGEWVVEPVRIESDRAVVKMSNEFLCVNDILGTENEENGTLIFNNEFSKINLGLDQQIPVEVVFLKSVKEIYVQMTDNKEKLLEMMSEIQQYCLETKVNSYTPQRDEAVCAKFTDGLWYRAYVIRLVENHQFEVHFVDYGNEHVTHAQDLRPMSRNFLVYPVGCFCVELDQVSEIDEETAYSLLGDGIMKVVALKERPVVVLMKGEVCVNDILRKEEPANQAEKFTLITRDAIADIPVKLGQKIDVMVVHLNCNDVYVQPVEDSEELLQLLPQIQDHCLKKTLKPYTPSKNEVVCAKFTGGIWYRAVALHVEDDENVKVCFIDFGNEYVTSVEDIRSISKKLAGFKVGCFCVHLDSVTDMNEAQARELLLDKKWLMEVLKLEGGHATVRLSNDTVCANNILKANRSSKSVYRNELPETILNVGQKADVVVVYIQSAKQIYINLVAECEKLSTLMSSIKSHCSGSNTSTYNPLSDEIVCAKYVDGVWYRAHVMEPVDDSNYRVHFVDYGNDHVVSVKNIRPFNAEFLALPAAASCVELDGVTEIGSEAASALGRGPLVMEVIRREGERIIVKLANNDICINDTLRNDTEVTEKSYFGSHLPKRNLTEGQKMDVQVVFIKTARKIFVQPVVQTEKLLLLMRKIADYCKSTDVSSFCPRDGELLCAKFEGIWYRAQAISPDVENNYNVHFIDYGDDHVVSSQDIRRFIKDFVDFPSGAVCVELDGVSEINSDALKVLEEGQWTMEIVKLKGEHLVATLSRKDICINSVLRSDSEMKEAQFLKSDLPRIILAEGQRIVVKVVFIQSSQKLFVQPPTVRESLLAMMNEIQSYCETTDFVSFSPQKDEMVCARFNDSMWYRACVVESVGDGSYKVHFVDYGNEDVVTLKSMRPFKTKFFVHPLGCLCVGLHGVSAIDAQFATVLGHGDWTMEVITTEGEYALVKLCNDSVCINDILGEPHVEHSFSRTDLPKNILKMGQTADVHVSHVYSAGQIYVQLLENTEKLSKLMAEIQDHCAQTKHSYSPKKDEMVCAKFVNVWYRAHVMEPDRDNKYQVHFVDFGNMSVVSTEDIRPLKKDFLSLPVAAFCIELHNVVDIDVQVLSSVLSEGEWVLEVIALEKDKNVARLSNGSVCVNDILSTLQDDLDKTFKKDLPKNVLKIGQKTSVAVVFIQSAKEIYVQLASEQEKLLKLMVEIHEYCVSLLNEQYSPVNDEIVCAKFNDDVWYRAHVIQREGERFKVHLIDYGNDYLVLPQDIRPLKKAFSFLPHCAIRIELHEVSIIVPEVRSVLSEGKWTVEVLTLEGDQTIVRLYSGDICANDIIKDKCKDISFTEKHNHDTAGRRFLFTELDNESPPLHEKLSVQMVHFKSADEMYVQDSSRQSQLPSLMKKIQMHCENSPTYQSALVAGELVCARFTDGAWYRASVLSVKDNEKFHVFSFDYGKECVVDATDIRPFHEDFISFPVGAFRIRLDNVTEIASDIVCSLCQKELSLEVTRFEEDCAVVQMKLNDISLNEVLACTYAISVQEQPRKAFMFGDCPSSTLILGQQVSLVVTCLHSPEMFFCQLSSAEALQKLNDLNNDIRNYCQEETTIYTPAVKEICLAYCKDKKSWLRAIALKLEPFTLMFPDYGYIIEMSDDGGNIRPIKPEYVELPWQAVQCSLAGIKTESTWSKEVLQELHSLLPDGKVIDVTAVKMEDSSVFIVDVPFVRMSLIRKKLVREDDTLSLEPSNVAQGQSREELEEELQKQKEVIAQLQQLILKASH